MATLPGPSKDQLYVRCVNTHDAYTWDDDKGARNLRVHGIAFEDAVKISEGPTLERLDDRFDYPETRWYAIGLAEGRPITVIYTDVDDETRRIISAWKAETHEEKRTSTISKRKTDWRRVDALTDERIRRGIEADPDARPTDEDFWKKATLVMPQVKETMTIRLDADVLEWFRRQGKGYQTRINAILRSYVRAHGDADVKLRR